MTEIMENKSAEHEEARREMRVLMLGEPDHVRYLYYRTITLAEHEAVRRALTTQEQ